MNKARTTPGSRRRILGALAVAMVAVAVVVTGCGGGGGESVETNRAAGHNEAIYKGQGKVAYLLPSVTIKIWSGSWVPQFASYLKQVAPNVEVLPYYANFSVATQLSQAQAAIAQGAKVLIVAAVDPEQTKALGEYAAAHDVKIIAAERQFLNAEIAGYVGDRAIEIGETMGKWLKENTSEGQTIATLWGDATDAFYALEQKKGALKYLEPLFKSGERKEAGGNFTPEYLPSNAHSEMAAILSKTNNEVNAVLSANDDMAGGVIAALDAADIKGVKVVGGDATVEAIQRILKGTQAMTVYHGLGAQETAAKAAAYILAGEPFPEDLFNATLPNGEVEGKKIEVPFKYEPPMPITKENVDEVVNTKFLTKELICKGMPAGIEFCE